MNPELHQQQEGAPSVLLQQNSAFGAVDSTVVATLKSAAAYSDWDQVKQLLAKAFESADADSTGRLEWEELWRFCKDIDIGLDDDTIGLLYGSIDTDGSGSVEWSEMLEPLLEFVKSNAEQQATQEAQQAAPSMEHMESVYGAVDVAVVAAIKTAVKEEDWETLNSYLGQAFQSADASATGTLAWEEFWRLCMDLELGLDDDAIGLLQGAVDSNQNGEVEWSELVGPLTEHLREQTAANAAQ